MIWPTVRLGDVVQHRKEFIEIDDLHRYRRPRVQLHARGVVLRDEIEGSRIKTKKQQVCATDDFLVAEIDAKVGGFGLVPRSLDGSIVSSHYFLYRVNREKLIPEYLDFFCKTPFFRDQVSAQGSTNYAAIRPHHVLEYTIPLPPIEEQRRIVAKIERLAAKVGAIRALRGETAATVETLREMGARSLLNAIPSQEWKPLGALVDLGGGGTPSKRNPAFWGGSIPWITPKDMKSREIEHSTDQITEWAVEESSIRLHPIDSVLIVVRGMILAHTVPVGLLRVPAAINQDMKALRANNSIRPEYLMSCLWALNTSLLADVERSTHDTRRLTTDRLLAFQIPCPSDDEQEQLLGRIRALDDRTVSLRNSMRVNTAMVDALLPSILDKAFKGEL